MRRSSLWRSTSSFSSMSSRQDLEGRKTLFQPVGLAAVQPHRDARQIFQKAPVMADQDQCAPARFQFAFQPFDGAHIQMIGGLVQQQDIRTRRQRPRQGGAARFAAREGGGILVAAQAQIAQQVEGAVGVFMRVQPGLDIVAGGGIAAQVGFLRQIADGGAGLGKAGAAIGFGQARRRFSARWICPNRCAPPGTAGHQPRR